MKRVLYIALQIYAKQIVDKMKELGYEVAYENDKPNEGVLCKALVRYQVPFYHWRITQYYRSLFDKYEKDSFDVILFLRAEFVTVEALKYCRERFPSARMVLYLWDSLRNYPFVQEKIQYFDKAYSFDSKDCKDYPELSFLPLFYIDEFAVKKQTIESKYDVSFVGTGHGDRPAILKRVKEQCEARQRTVFIYQFLPYKLTYVYNKLRNPHFRGMKMWNFHYHRLPYHAVADICATSKCIIDCESSTQSGLTMRTIEMLGMKKKLITTNADIVNYDFYHPDNVCVIDRKNVFVDFNFIDKPYVELDEKIYRKYSLQSWISTIIEE